MGDSGVAEQHGRTSYDGIAGLARRLDRPCHRHCVAVQFRRDRPILLAGAATGAAAPELQRAHPGIPALQRIDGALAAVEELMAAREHALG